ncbi:MAG: NDP-hexose 2,3-dehydratase family protein [Verrucomicrobiota bacterium]|jgi:oxidase EvaA|nr:NDP-hexose 2,3-dehydratase family protein [Verrucomicrobiota bacterium]
MSSSKEQRFLKSAMDEYGAKTSTEQVVQWLAWRNREVVVRVSPTRLSQMKDWALEESSGRIRHSSGKFFSIDGIRVDTNWGTRPAWAQPIINQPEIGFLGCITHEFNGVLHFLIQAKVEPGNVNCVQLSPTLQATKSNYTRVHHGKSPKFLEWFTDRSRSRVLLDQLQSEQGARFLHKRNRNIIIEVDAEIPDDLDFVWLTLGQIKRLMTFDNAVNMDLRTVVSGIPFGQEGLGRNPASFAEAMHASATETQNHFLPIDDIISWFTDQKTKFDLQITPCDLWAIEDWELSDECLRHKGDQFFRVIWVDVEISNREVTFWQQPLVEPVREGIIAFVVKRIQGVPHFLVQAKLECGNFDILEFAPTVQCITGSYANSLKVLPYLEYVLTAQADQIRYDTRQSEEGGRFYHEQNRNLVIEADEDFPVACPENYQWMTLNQLLMFARFNNYLNIQARSLLSTLRFV